MILMVESLRHNDNVAKKEKFLAEKKKKTVGEKNTFNFIQLILHFVIGWFVDYVMNKLNI